MSRVKGGKGYLIVDNRAAGGKLEEYATLTCAHCNKIVVLNPERKRARGFCRRCNAYTCDSVGCCTGCNPIQQGLELMQKYPDSSQPFLLRGKNGEILHDLTLQDAMKPYPGVSLSEKGAT